MIQARVREEIYYREALKMGLDRDDSIIRSRLQEKLEFLSQDVKKLPEPTERDLQSFLAAHPETFRTDARFTFRLVFVDAGRHGASTVHDAQSILVRLRHTPGLLATTMGDPLPFHRTCERAAGADVAKQFGSEFTATLSAMKLGQWTGPLETDDGAYLIYLQERIPGQLPSLDQIRPAVRKEWMVEQRQQANDKFYQGLLRNYTVNVELPQGIGTNAETRSATK